MVIQPDHIKQINDSTRLDLDRHDFASAPVTVLGLAEPPAASAAPSLAPMTHKSGA
jgi:hypothetical protein